MIARWFGLGGHFPKGLAPKWARPLPRGLVAPPAARPRALLHRGVLVAFGEERLLALDPASGDELASRRARDLELLGFNEAGDPLFRTAGRTVTIADASAAELAPAEGALPAATGEATDDPYLPEADPTLVIGRRTLRARIETRSRVTRHRLLLCDEGHPPREHEIAAYTLRSDRLRLIHEGGPRLFGRVGDEGEHPAASLVGAERGPLLVVTRRPEGWHEHGVSEGFPDLVGHGPVDIEALVIPEGHEPGWTISLGRVEERWEGLGRRSGSPPRLLGGIGVRAVGLADETLIVEVVEVAAGRGVEGLFPKRRHLAGFDAAASR